MVGITSYGAYLPMLRLPLAAIGGGVAKPGGPEKAVANWDEDAVTMAVAAAIDCLRGVERASVDGVLFASTSYPLKEKQGAALVARALDLRRDVMTADMGDSRRAWRRRARRSSRTWATAPRPSWWARTRSRSLLRRATRSRTRSSTCGAPRAILSCTRGRTASSSITATARACGRWYAGSSRRPGTARRT